MFIKNSKLIYAFFFRFYNKNKTCWQKQQYKRNIETRKLKSIKYPVIVLVVVL